MIRVRVLPELLLDPRQNETFMNYPDGKGGWDHYSTEKVRTTVEALALGLLEEGMEPGEAVGLIAPQPGLGDCRPRDPVCRRCDGTDL